MTTDYDTVRVPRENLVTLLALVNIAQREENDWRGALGDAEFLLNDLLYGDEGDESETRCADCGEEGETTGHMGCQYPRDHN